MNLQGQVVLVTRAQAQAGELCAALRAAGAEAVEVPVLHTVLVQGAALAALDGALTQLRDYDGVLVTSPNAAGYLGQRAQALGQTSLVGETTFYAIGAATAQVLLAQGATKVVVAKEAHSAGLLQLLRDSFGTTLPTRRFLFPRASAGREEVVNALRALSARVDVVSTYETLPLRNGPDLPQRSVDWVTFCSPSAVMAYVQRFGVPRAKVATIGRFTTAAAEKAGIYVSAEAQEASVSGLLRAMLAL